MEAKGDVWVSYAGSFSCKLDADPLYKVHYIYHCSDPDHTFQKVLSFLVSVSLLTHSYIKHPTDLLPTVKVPYLVYSLKAY